MKKNKNKRLEILDIEDPEAKRKAIEALLTQLSEKTEAAGEPLMHLQDVKARFNLSCSIILWASIFGTVLLTASSLYFMTLPAPLIYATTTDGQLYEIQPMRTK